RTIPIEVKNAGSRDLAGAILSHLLPTIVKTNASPRAHICVDVAGKTPGTWIRILVAIAMSLTLPVRRRSGHGSLIVSKVVPRRATHRIFALEIKEDVAHRTSRSDLRKAVPVKVVNIGCTTTTSARKGDPSSHFSELKSPFLTWHRWWRHIDCVDIK